MRIRPARVRARSLGRATALAALAAALGLLGGCVEREILLRSDPPGASVVLNGRDVGNTPLVLPFTTYGVYDVALSTPGRQRVRQGVEIKAPWYEHIPIDFFTETLWPFTVRDRHEITLELPALSPADNAGLNERETELRQRVENGAISGKE